jgi:hypothetical protein
MRFLSAANSLRRSGGLSETDKSHFDLVFKGREALKAVHSKSQLDFDNFEEIYSAFDMAALIGKLGALSDEEVRKLPAAMRRLVTRTIELQMKFPVIKEKVAQAVAFPASGGGIRIADHLPRIAPPPTYVSFVDVISNRIQESSEDVAIITFNYDLGIDYALYCADVRINYGLETQQLSVRERQRSVDLLKLHGSLNWGRCSNTKCNEVVVSEFKDYFSSVKFGDYVNENTVSLDVASRLCAMRHCAPSPLEDDPIIVPPTWNKGGFHSEFKSVWSLAAKHLGEAENIFIIGYSFPKTDQFFKYFFALGSVGDGWIEKVVVCDPDLKVGERVQELLGPLVKSKFKSMPLKFENAIERLMK